MERHTDKTSGPKPYFPDTEIAELPDTCQEKIREFERELNKQGYWNIALVAYQMKN